MYAERLAAVWVSWRTVGDELWAPDKPGLGDANVIDDRELKRLIDKYLRRFAKYRQADRERSARTPELAAAIREASLARQAKGECEPHQRRVGLGRLAPFERSLQNMRRRRPMRQPTDRTPSPPLPPKPRGLLFIAPIRRSPIRSHRPVLSSTYLP